MVSVLCFTLVGSYIASTVPKTTMGSFSTLMTLFLGIKFIVKPVVEPKQRFQSATAHQKALRSVACGAVVGFICGFVGAGGGMMMLLVLTSVLGYELKTAVGTSVFIMSATAFTGSVSHFVIGGLPDMEALIICIISTLIFAQVAASLANKASPLVLNRVTGSILVILGVAILAVNHSS